jgi:hypothetical protein
MSELSDVSILFGQHVLDIERARDIFTAETRRFIGDLLSAIENDRTGSWSSPKIQIKTKDAELENEGKSTGFLSRQYVIATLPLCFKIRVKYMAIAEINFGVEFDVATGSFAWRVKLVPSSRYQWLDEVVWTEWQKAKTSLPPGASHEPKEGVVVFMSRCFGPDLTFKLASEDITDVLGFLVGAEPALVSQFAKQLVDEAMSESQA